MHRNGSQLVTSVELERRRLAVSSLPGDSSIYKAFSKGLWSVLWSRITAGWMLIGYQRRWKHCDISGPSESNYPLIRSVQCTPACKRNNNNTHHKLTRGILSDDELIWRRFFNLRISAAGDE